ncbi:MAG: DnaA/Hda family protein [Gammaproteobacteria bacterium]|nr:DnaA/Hda family protein [Gammaproteobacteria bacterium]
MKLKRHIPNLICILRLLLAPVIVTMLARGHYGQALLLLGVAALSDWLDGFLAKRWKLDSYLGSILDPMADKVLIASVYVTLAALSHVPAWLAVVVIVRDLVIVVGWQTFRLLRGELRPRPSRVSRLNTFVQIWLGVAVIAAEAFGGFLPALWIQIGGALALLLAVLSGVDYVLGGSRLAAQRKRQETESAGGERRQLQLDVSREDPCVFENFYNGANADVVTALRSLISRDGVPPFWLWGAPATGKTHLLLAAVRAASDQGLTSAYLPAHAGFKPDALDALRNIELLCIDDADRIAGAPQVEEAMGGLCRELERRGSRLVLAAASTPAGAGFERDDMRTRLASGQIWKLQPLTDEERLEAVQLRVRSRGIKLPAATARFLMRRVRRNPSDVFSLVDQLAALAASRSKQLTVPFVRLALREGVLEARTGR